MIKSETQSVNLKTEMDKANIDFVEDIVDKNLQISYSYVEEQGEIPF